MLCHLYRSFSPQVASGGSNGHEPVQSRHISLSQGSSKMWGASLTAWGPCCQGSLGLFALGERGGHHLTPKHIFFMPGHFSHTSFSTSFCSLSLFTLLGSCPRTSFCRKAYIFQGRTSQPSTLSFWLASIHSSPTCLVDSISMSEGGGTWLSLRRQFSKTIVVVSATHRTFQWLEFPHRSYSTHKSGDLIAAVQSSGRTKGERRQ